MAGEDKEKITGLLDVLWDDLWRMDNCADDLLDQVKALEYRLEDVKENCRDGQKHLRNLYEYFGIEEE